jgi:uncharacterized membrane protein SpoIIM required for sporulation/uncharacterized RDD family membrane protein YckC
VQTLDIETPELVVVSYTIAGVGSRAFAALIDYLICIAAMLAVLILGASLGFGFGARGNRTMSASLTIAFLVLGQFAVLWGYYVLFEGLADGQTPGKRYMRLRVVRDGGYSVTFSASAVRNLLRLVDLQPVFTYVVGLVSIMVTRSGKRLGDIVAGTIVVREALVRQPVAAGSPRPKERAAAASPAAPAETVLTDEQFAVLSRFTERRASLTPERRAALAAQLARGMASALATVDTGGSELARLVKLHELEQLARSRGAVSLGAVGAAREQHAIVASGTPRWASFATRLTDAQRRGLRALGEEDVRRFVAEYRDLTADLARLRTASQGEVTDEVFLLSRLVSGAHNLLYRSRTLTLTDVARALLVDSPREVRRSMVPVLLAAVMMFGPAVVAYTAVVRHPEVARIFIPPSMLDRATEGVRRAREGRGYITDPQIFRPVMASRIVANNVQVTFAAFGAGLTAGIGTLYLLVMNGVSIGGIFGLYASKGIGRLLLAFVAPHGVLELTAICIAGGAGLLLAAAILIPGNRTRRRALVENGRRAILLIAASTVLLLIAGTLEGLVSPIETWPLSWKLAVSAATVVFLVAYLSGGRRKRAVATEKGEAQGELLGLG